MNELIHEILQNGHKNCSTIRRVPYAAAAIVLVGVIFHMYDAILFIVIKNQFNQKLLPSGFPNFSWYRNINQILLIF